MGHGAGIPQSTPRREPIVKGVGVKGPVGPRSAKRMLPARSCIRATGAGKIHEIVFGVIPQVVPLWVSFTLYRVESNLRSATALGLVDAGGIGQILWKYIRGFYYSETAVVMIVIVVSVSLLDILSQPLRRMLI